MAEHRRPVGDWKPVGGIERPWIEEPGPGARDLRTEVTGTRNGFPEQVPYTWNPGAKEREEQVAARLAAIREHVNARLNAEREDGDE